MRRAVRECVVAILILGITQTTGWGQAPQPLSEAQRKTFETAAAELQADIDQNHLSADHAIFAKGLTWALKYDREFTPADVVLLEKAIQRARERQSLKPPAVPPWYKRQGKLALGYLSKIDHSVQPYGLIVPKGFDPKTPCRLDVVLHGSTRPVGMSELKFIARFDEGDGPNPSPPDQPFIELHPLGRVENCYRWAGETDVFEAIDNVCTRYNIDRGRIVLRGMSMGASGTWHLGLKHPDRFAALGPYCGYVDTHKFSETPLPNFVKIGALPEHQELGLHMLDSVDYAANAGVVPAIACMGEKDIFFQAHVIMGEAMQREGLTMTNLISPGTGHVIDPVTHAEQMRRIAEHVADAPRRPSELRFVTWTLKYNRCHWLEVLQLDQHYARAELSAKLVSGRLMIDEPRNISRFAILVSALPERAKWLRIGVSSTEILVPDTERIELARRDDGWGIAEEQPAARRNRKRPGLQGPIDDAFTEPFLCVRGTGQPWNVSVQEYADASLRRFADEWQHYFRGTLPIKNDDQVTPIDIQTRNLILFGDPGSNSLIARVLPQLPLVWTKHQLRMDGQEYAAATHAPALIAPNPLPLSGGNYFVLNSGHTFREAELAKVNYLLFPRWGDWAVLQIPSDQKPSEPLTENVIRAGYFDEQWQFKK